MAFTPRNNDSGKARDLPLAASTTVTKGQLLKFSSGYLFDAAAGDDEVEFVALEAVTAAATDGETFCNVLPIDDETEFDALCSTTLVQATHVGNSYDLTDAVTVNLGATTDKVFHIDRIAPGTTTHAIGRFNKPAIA